jgi:hypothetical protein
VPTTTRWFAGTDGTVGTAPPAQSLPFAAHPSDTTRALRTVDEREHDTRVLRVIARWWLGAVGIAGSGVPAWSISVD